MSPNMKTCLKAMREILKDDEPGNYLPFWPIIEKTKLDRKVVRRAVRALARIELVEYANGLCSEDGTFFGAGYRITKKGWD